MTLLKKIQMEKNHV